jgi:hypothetical protein
MGKKFIEYCDGTKIYSCANCGVHLSSASWLNSKAFWAGNGKAYLYNKVINLGCGEAEDRMMRTGIHRVCDLICK